MKQFRVFSLRKVARVALLAVGIAAVEADAQKASTGRTAEAKASRADWPLVAQGVLSARLGREDTSYDSQNHGTGYQVANRRHGFVAAFSELGVVLTAGKDEWRLVFLGCGEGEKRGIRQGVAPTASGNRVEYRRGALTEWYVNGPLGLEQGFTVHEPIWAGATELGLRLKVGGTLAAVTDADGRGLSLRPADGSASYRFGGLVAFDASGRSLTARMRVRGDELIYTVDVAGARYPVVIDPQFTGGPSVRVSANDRVEFRWNTDVQWFGEAWVYDNPDGTGAPVLTRRSEDGIGNPLAAMQHTISVNVLAPLAPDTGYFFKITATDPTGSLPSFSTPAPLPPFFTGAQAIGNVFVQPDVNRAVISWEANVIGFGSVMYGTSALDQGPVTDAANSENHSIELTGLTPGTTYQFRVSNHHAIDGDVLAERSGQFTTATVTAADLTHPAADPRRVNPGQLAMLSIRAKKSDGTPAAGVAVSFAIEADSRGTGTLSGSSATTDASGIASVEFTAGTSGIVRVRASSTSATNRPTIAVVVN